MKVRIAGVGFQHELEVPDGSSLAVAIGEANIEQGNLQARVGGEAVDPETFTLQDGQTVVLAPPEVKLGA